MFYFSSICFYIVVRYIFGNIKLSEKTSRAICSVGRLTFGIYLISDCFIALFAPLYNDISTGIPTMAAMLLYQLAVFVCSAVAAALLRAIPVIKNFI